MASRFVFLAVFICIIVMVAHAITSRADRTNVRFEQISLEEQHDIHVKRQALDRLYREVLIRKKSISQGQDVSEDK